MVYACTFLYILGGIFRYIDLNVENLPIRFSAISYLSFCTLCLVVLIFTRKNIPHPITRRDILLGMSLLIIWEFISVSEFMLFPIDHVGKRAFWHLFFFPALAIPNLFLIATSYYDKPLGQATEKKWFLSLGVTALLWLVIFTNDYHNLAFRYPYGYENYSKGYTFGPASYIAVIWMYVMFILSAWNMVRKGKFQKMDRKGFLAIAGLAISLIYTIWYATGRPIFPGFNDVFGITEIFMGLIVLTIGGCIAIGLIRSNFNYLELFEAADLNAYLVDNSGRVRYVSKNAIETTAAQRQEAVDHNIYIDKDHRLECQKLSAGYVFWVDDISSINRLAEDLRDIHGQLQQEYALIKAENDIVARRIKADEQNRLYSLMAKYVEPEIEIIRDLLHETDVDSPDFKQKLAKACIYNAYVKRCCNINLLKQENSLLNSFELESSLRESLEYIRINGVTCSHTIKGSGTFYADKLLMVYSVFQKTVESLIDGAGLKSVNVALNITSAGLDMTLVCGCRDARVAFDLVDGEVLPWHEEKIAAFDVKAGCRLEEEKKQVIIELSVPGDQSIYQQNMGGGAIL